MNAAPDPAVFLKTLEKLPPFQGVVFRGCPAETEFARDGQVTVTTGFTATTRRPDLVAGTGTIYAIYTTTAREISAFSAQKDEYETVVLPGTTLALAETRELSGLDIRLVFEFTPGQQIPPETVETIATTVEAWLADITSRPDPRPRFIGDIV
ncbi:MAG: hypothetical protein ACRDSJ_15455 [Rubrobacteraceae bacterium]